MNLSTFVDFYEILRHYAIQFNANIKKRDKDEMRMNERNLNDSHLLYDD